MLQVFIPSDGRTKNQFKVEVTVTDAEKNKRRLIFHSGGGKQDITINQFHARIPTGAFLRDVWLNLSIDIFAFSHFCFKGVQVKSIDGISVTSQCRIRRIFTMRSPLYDDDVDGSEDLQAQLDALTRDEFGGAAS